MADDPVDLAAARRRRARGRLRLRDLIPIPSTACPRCGDPEGAHRVSEAGFVNDRNRRFVRDEIATETRSCALYRVGTQLERLNDNLSVFLTVFGQEIERTIKEDPT